MSVVTLLHASTCSANVTRIHDARVNPHYPPVESLIPVAASTNVRSLVGHSTVSGVA